MTIPVTHRDEVCARLTPVIETAASGQRVIGVLVLRLENLRTVTLSRGYPAGEATLKHAWDSLAAVARRQDWFARIGDQDFVLVAPGMVGASQMLLAANKLLRTLSESFQFHGDAIPLQARMGIACGPQDGATGAVLLQAGERALLHAEQRDETVALYTAKGDDDARTDWHIEELFDAAFERGEFELWYQPKFRLTDRQLVGAEGLSRWTSSVLGTISPATFIPIAERCGKIDRLTWSAINTALQHQSEWLPHGGLSVAVNISAICLRSTDLAGRIGNALGLWGANPQKLTIEVTESAVMRDPESSFRVLKELRQMGIRVSIDDFGTGQSSLAYFKSLPADELKIDRSFIMHMKDDAANRNIVQTIIELAHRLGHEVVAEGIEDAATARLLTEFGCDIAQGYHLGRPMPAGPFHQMTVEHNTVVLPASGATALAGTAGM